MRVARARSLRFCVVVLLTMALDARAALVEQQVQMPVSIVDAFGKHIEQAITVTLFHDDATPTPRPAIVINHGRAGAAEERGAMGRARFPAASAWFAKQGFLVAVPTRVGYGVTGGEDVEDTGACGDRRFAPGFAAAADQVASTLDLLRQRSDVDVERLVVLGQSFGGGTVVAVAARNPPGVVLAINFAGGSGGDPKNNPRNPCSPNRMESLYARYGHSAHVPMLWAYTENDQYWGPKIPHEWFAAFTGGGADAEFHQFTPHGTDGHLLFSRFPEVWQPVVADFLRRHGFEIKE
ncbi:MAG TPA: dienelactone hydrolase family protein [Burkholderiaceae bacterium]|jgi:dienelactone hydrolase